MSQGIRISRVEFNQIVADANIVIRCGAPSYIQNVITQVGNSFFSSYIDRRTTPQWGRTTEISKEDFEKSAAQPSAPQTWGF